MSSFKKVSSIEYVFCTSDPECCISVVKLALKYLCLLHIFSIVLSTAYNLLILGVWVAFFTSTSVNVGTHFNSQSS